MGCYRKNSVPLDADGGVKVLSEKRGIIKIFKITEQEPATDELKRYLLPATALPFSTHDPFSI